MNRNAFFAALLGLLASPFAWAASKLRADQLQSGATGVLRLLAIGTDNRFASLAIGSGLNYDGSTLSATPPVAAAPVILARNPDGTYPYSGGAVFRNGLLQVAPDDYTTSGGVLTPKGWNADDTVVKF